MKKNIVFLFLFVILANACKETNTLPKQNNFDYGYFPTKSGRWVEYKVKELNIDKDINVFDTTNYFIRYQYGGIYVDATKDTMQLVKRFYRKKSTDEWKKLNTWYAGIKENKAIQVEENIKYVKLYFPLVLDKTWNGNIYNHTDTLKEFLYKIVNLDVAETINNLTFDSVVTVKQRDFVSEVEKYFYQEKYAKHVGLIKKQAVSIYSKDINSNVPIEERITKGTARYISIVAYGN